MCACVRRITRINFKLYNNDVFIFNDGNCIHDRVHWHWCSCRNVHERSHGVRYRVRDANALERLLGLVGQCALERAWCGRLGMVLAPDNIVFVSWVHRAELHKNFKFLTWTGTATGRSTGTAYGRSTGTWCLEYFWERNTVWINLSCAVGLLMTWVTRLRTYVDRVVHWFFDNYWIWFLYVDWKMRKIAVSEFNTME